MKTPHGVGDRVYSHNLQDSAAQTLACPGILVFSPTMELLHVNRRAMELTCHTEKGTMSPVRSAHSREVIEVCAEVQEAFNTYVKTGIWAPLEARQIVSYPERWILVRGFGLLDHNAIQHSRIVIVLDEVSFGEKQTNQPLEAHVRAASSHRTITETLATR